MDYVNILSQAKIQQGETWASLFLQTYFNARACSTFTDIQHQLSEKKNATEGQKQFILVLKMSLFFKMYLFESDMDDVRPELS